MIFTITCNWTIPEMLEKIRLAKNKYDSYVINNAQFREFLLFYYGPEIIAFYDEIKTNDSGNA